MKKRPFFTRLFARPSQGGSSLVFALVIIAVLGISLAAGLPQAQTSLNAHKKYADLLDDELSRADGAVDKEIHTIRYDDTFGIDGGSGQCADDTASTYLGTLPAAEGGFQLWCRPEVNSGGRLGSSSGSPPHSIVTLGGQAKQTTLTALGKTYTAPGLFREQSDSPVGTGEFRYPACADMHGFQAAGTDRCEAGMLIGRGTDPESGGLYIANNGTNSTEPLVVSNSAIIASNSGGFGRELFVEGDVQARGFCGAGSNIHAGTLDASKIHANVSGPGDAGELADCHSPEPLELDPGYPRAPFKLPEYRPYTATPFQCVGAGACIRPVGWNDLNPAALCTDGLVRMPADETSAGSGWFAAWYTNSAALNNLMSAPECRDALFWFRPGVYYFDFLDANNGPAWEAPLGCLSANGACTASEIIGGTPVGWNSCPPPTPVGNCDQPPRVLATSNPSWSADWDWENKADRTVVIDDDPGMVEIWKDNQNEWLQHDKLQPPIPQRANTSVQSVKFEIAYSLPDPGSYDNIAPSASAPVTGPFGAVLDISSPNYGHCFIHLRPITGTDDLVDGANPPRAKTVVDLTNGCDLSQNASLAASNSPYTFLKNEGFPASFAGLPAVVNTMVARVEVKALGTVQASNKAQMYVDGMQWLVSWKGRPAPPYPNGCDPTNKGVQFVFGSNARVAWGTGATENAFVELCALRARDVPTTLGSSYMGAFGLVNHMQVTGNDFGIGLYGLNEDSAPPPLVMSTDPTQTANGRKLLPIQFEPGTNDEITSFAPAWRMVDSAGVMTNLKWGSNDPNNCVSAPLPPDTLQTDRCEKDYKVIGDGTPLNHARVEAIPWAGNGAASFSFRLAPDLTSNAGADYYIPPGSTILSVRVKIAHREGSREMFGAAAGTYYPADEVVSTTLKVVPGQGGTGSNGMDAWMWHSPDSTTGVSQYPGNMQSCVGGNMMAPAVDNPFTTGYNETLPTSTCLRPCERTAAPQYCIFEWGDRSAWSDVWNPPADKKGWSYQRSLTDALDTPEALQDSLWTWRVNVNNFPGGSTRLHEAVLDGVVVEIEYRRSDSPRPLRGCMTTRLGWRPDALLSDGSWTWDRNRGAGAPGTGTGLPRGYGWYDRDWGARWGGVNENEYFRTDEAFGNGSSNASPANGNDTEDCPLLELINNKGRVKFHMQGMLYAPSAALSLSGRDNEAQWSTHGIVARHVSAIRWIDPGSDIPAVGNPNIRRAPRKVTLELKKNGVVKRRVVVSIDDLEGKDFGHATDVLSWVDNP